jgi:hypothetical protein
MKKILIGTIVAASASLSSISARADDPCQVVLCMFGMVQGQESNQCKDSIDSYFGIVAWRHGHPDLSGTARNRLSFTQQCKSAPNNFISMIDQTFGNVIR